MTDEVCADCEHPRRDHADGLGVCTHEPDPLCLNDLPCKCNLFRTTPPAWREYDVQDAIDVACTHNVVAHVELVPLEFVLAMEAVMREGLDRPGRYVGSWKDLTKDEAKAKLHNMYVHAGDQEFDSVACNALILWWHFQREDPE